MKTAVKTLIEELNNQLDVSQIARLENLFVEMLELEKQEAEAPYKVDIIEEKVAVSTSVEQAMAQTAVQPTKCGCGRSSTGFCVGLHKLTEAEWAVHADNPKKSVAEKPVKRPRKPAATKTTAATKTKSKKPSATKTTVKKAKK